MRLAELCAYQDHSYARRYLSFVKEVWSADQDHPARRLQLTRAVLRGLYKLMAYKDEYEVARLATGKDSEERIRVLFDGEVEIVRKLHPPTLRRFLSRKIGFGRTLRPALVLLSRLKGLRGSVFDLFGRTASRRTERELIGWYCKLIEEVVQGLDGENYELGVEIAQLPEDIRGYEEVKDASVITAKKKAEDLFAALRARRSASDQG